MSRVRARKDDEQEVFYTTALTPEMANGHLQHAHPVTPEGGEYVMFTYEGLGTGLQEFILTVYGTCMPMLNLTRRKADIERFYPEDESRDQPRRFSCAASIDPDPPLTLQLVHCGASRCRRRPPFPPPSRKPATLLIVDARNRAVAQPQTTLSVRRQP